MDEWYYIGPDKTGLLCSDCCAGFSDKNGSCQPYSCPVASSSFRPYICPNPSFPSPEHVYAWTNTSKSSVSIIVNSYFCPSSSTTCWSVSPSTGLNAGGRVGGVGCSSEPVYVSSFYNCHDDNRNCGACDETCCVKTGANYTPRSCVSSAGGCNCVSGSSVNTCSCLCFYQGFDSEAPCYSEPLLCPPNCPCDQTNIDCPDGTTLYYCVGDTPPECPIPCEGEEPSCGGCWNAYCNFSTGSYVCPPNCPSGGCGAGFSCSCGNCFCTTASTCCTANEVGWSFQGYSSSPRCKACYRGWENSSRNGDCCDEAWIRKNCNPGSICCNDGRCYSSSTVMCDINVYSI